MPTWRCIASYAIYYIACALEPVFLSPPVLMIGGYRAWNALMGWSADMQGPNDAPGPWGVPDTETPQGDPC